MRLAPRLAMLSGGTHLRYTVEKMWLTTASQLAYTLKNAFGIADRSLIEHDKGSP